jgi:hypothetical protein
VAFKVPITPTEYYLLSYRNKILFDAKLPAAGILVMKINETVVNAGLRTNAVNADENNKGVGVIEADGRKDMDNNTNRGDAGDVFPGSVNVVSFNNSTNPRSTGRVAICNIGQPGTTISADLITSSGTCQATTPASWRRAEAAFPLSGCPQAGPRGWDPTGSPAAGRGCPSALRGSRRRGSARAV